VKPLKAATLLLATMAALTTAACTHDGRHPATAPEPSTPTAGVLPADVVAATAVPTAVPNNPASRKNVAISACAATKGGWKATGSADNPSGTKLTYTITVFFTSDAATVLGTGQTKVTVQPHSDQQWTVAAKFRPAPQTLCVLRGVAEAQPR
jgi:hypothetical protein